MSEQTGKDADVYRVTADRNLCCGYGTCFEICPEVYTLEGGLVVLAVDSVSGDLAERAIEGAESCPQGALAVERIEI